MHQNSPYCPSPAPPNIPPHRRLRRLDPRAFGARRSRSFSFTTRTLSLLVLVWSRFKPRVAESSWTHQLVDCIWWQVIRRGVTFIRQVHSTGKLPASDTCACSAAQFSTWCGARTGSVARPLSDFLAVVAARSRKAMLWCVLISAGNLDSVLWRCRLGDRKGIRSAKQISRQHLWRHGGRSVWQSDRPCLRGGVVGYDYNSYYYYD